MTRRGPRRLLAARPGHTPVPAVRLGQAVRAWNFISTFAVSPSVSLGTGKQAKKPKRPGRSRHIRAAIKLNCLADLRFSCPIGPPGIPAGSDKTATLIPKASIAFRLTSGDHGRFSAGVRNPTDRLCSALGNVVGKMWWCTSMRHCSGVKIQPSHTKRNCQILPKIFRP